MHQEMNKESPHKNKGDNYYLLISSTYETNTTCTCTYETNTTCTCTYETNTTCTCTYETSTTCTY